MERERWCRTMEKESIMMQKLEQKYQRNHKSLPIFSLVLIFLSTVKGSTTEDMKHRIANGVIIEPLGQIILAKDFLKLKLNLSGLGKQAEILSGTINDIKATKERVMKIIHSQEYSCKQDLSWKLFKMPSSDWILIRKSSTDYLEQAEKMLWDLNEEYFGHFFVFLEKESLSGSIGSFGKANLNKQVPADQMFSKEVNMNLTIVEHQAKLIDKITEDISRVNEMCNKTSCYTNPTLYIVLIENLHYDVSTLVSQYETLFKDILLASKGVVSPTLMIPANLKAILSDTENQNTVKSTINIGEYFPLLKAELLSQYILIHIPIRKDDDKYSISRVHKFPILHHNIFLSPDINDRSLVIVSSKKQHLAFPSENDVKECISPSSHTNICPSLDMVFYSSTFVASNHKLNCIAALLRNLYVQTSCQFRASIIKDIYTLPISNVMYILIPRPIRFLTYTCHGKTNTIHNVRGSYVFTKKCELTSDDFTILPSTSREEKITVQLPIEGFRKINNTFIFAPKTIQEKEYVVQLNNMEDKNIFVVQMNDKEAKNTSMAQLNTKETKGVSKVTWDDTTILTTTVPMAIISLIIITLAVGYFLYKRKLGSSYIPNIPSNYSSQELFATSEASGGTTSSNITV